jgi:ketosteroid isomerase-like protein
MNDMREVTHQQTASPSDVAVDLYVAVSEGHVERARGLLTPDAVLHIPEDNPLAGDHVGVDAILSAVGPSGTGARAEFEIIDILEGHAHAAVYCRVTELAPDGPPLDNLTVHLLRVDGRRVAEIWFHNRDQAAVDDFWRAAS